MGRVLIDKGFFVQGVNVGSIIGDPDVDIPHYLAFQVFEEDGKPSKGSYEGAGYVTEKDEHSDQYVVLGDPYKSTQLPSYKISPVADPESEKNLDDFAAGVKGGKRGKKNANANWREGFEEGKKLRRF